MRDSSASLGMTLRKADRDGSPLARRRSPRRPKEANRPRARASAEIKDQKPTFIGEFVVGSLFESPTSVPTRLHRRRKL